MKGVRNILGLLVLEVIILISCRSERIVYSGVNVNYEESSDQPYSFKEDTIARYGQERIGSYKFMPETISLSGRNEGNLSYSSLYKTYIFRVFDADLSDPLKLISYSEKRKAEIISENIKIDSKYKEWDFNFDRKGKRFYFTSDRPMLILGDTALNSNIWVANYNNGKWGIPDPLPYPVNVVDSYSGYPTFTNRDEMYFHSGRDKGRGDDDIYYCKKIGKQYKELRLLDYPVNTRYNDRDPAISPDGKIMAFFSDRPGGSFADGDLYIIFMDDSGSWSDPLPLGYLIGYAGHPYISNDGRYLFYTGSSGADTDIYRVELSELMEELLPVNNTPCKISGLLSGSISTYEDEIPLAFSLESETLIFSRTPSNFSDWLNEPIYYSVMIGENWDAGVRIENHNSNWIMNLPESVRFRNIAVPVWLDQAKSINIDLRFFQATADSLYLETNPGYPLNTDFVDSWPTIDSLGNLYFFSNRPGGNGKWSVPFNLGAEVNTRFDENRPVMGKKKW